MVQNLWRAERWKLKKNKAEESAEDTLVLPSFCIPSPLFPLLSSRLRKKLHSELWNEGLGSFGVYKYVDTRTNCFIQWGRVAEKPEKKKCVQARLHVLGNMQSHKNDGSAIAGPVSANVSYSEGVET